MPEATPGHGVDIRVLTAAEAGRVRADLASVLVDCVEGGASIGFMWPFTGEDAARWWDGVFRSVERSGTVLLGAFSEGRAVGSVQLGIEQPPNQPHRADLKKMMVHRSARGRGVGGALLRAAEDEARARGLKLLVLDTAQGSEGDRLYSRLGWSKSGIIPGYAYMPDGRSFCDTVVYWKAL